MPRGRPRSGSDYVPRIRVNFRLEPEVAKALERAAKRQKLSRNAYVDRVLRVALETEGLLK
jgi:predicted HicB family RNase H-like nuclease